jgi:TonB family protein
MRQASEFHFSYFMCAVIVVALHGTPAFADEAPTDASSQAASTRARVEAGCKRVPYPPESVKNGETGDVDLGLSISESGEVRSAVVLKSSGFPALDQAAADTMTQCRFKPATRNGAAIDSKIRFKVSWTQEQLLQARAASLGKTGYLREASTGSNVGRPSLQSSVHPLKRYHELTPEEQAYVKGYYERMHADDEPPYPLYGLNSLYKPLTEAQGRLGVEGLLSLEVQVDSTGKATEVRILNTPSAEMGKFASSVAMLTEYKPAVCRGQACAMAFPVRLNLMMRR